LPGDELGGVGGQEGDGFADISATPMRFIGAAAA
jgi:hypothetical protein